jgi:acyl-CoA thioester hydrolase
MGSDDLHNFSVTIEPRFYETDALGHINNASIAAWLEIVRMKFIASLCAEESYEAQSWILASLQIDFIAETFFGENVIGRVTDAKVGNTSLTVFCEMHQGGKLTVNAKAILVFMDDKTRAPTRVPEFLRKQLGASS